MKVRIVSSLIGLCILGVALYFYDTLALSAFVFLLCALAIMELFHAAGLTKYRFLCVVSLLFCLALVFQNTRPVSLFFARIIFGFIVALFLYQLYRHETLRIEQTCYAFFMTILVSMSFYCLILMKEIAGAQVGVFYLFLALGSAWWADSGAFFVGTFLGKHKLCPTVSPKKTVEGLVGGILTAMLGNLLVCVLYESISMALVPTGYFIHHVSVNIPMVLILTPVLSLLGVLGDLSASVIKRQYGVKDFGHIMPGHGGIMDRFDSVLFITPAIFMILNIFPLVSVIE